MPVPAEAIPLMIIPMPRTLEQLPVRHVHLMHIVRGIIYLVRRLGIGSMIPTLTHSSHAIMGKLALGRM